MKLTLEFDLPADRHEYDRAHHANDAWGAIDEALRLIRNHQKHGALTAAEVIEQVRDTLGAAWENVE